MLIGAEFYFKGYVPGVGIINPTKQAYQLMQIFTFGPHFEVANGCEFVKHSDNPSRFVAIFLHEHKIKRLATIKKRENNRTALCLLEVTYVFARQRILCAV